jgi:hypothetical protein
MSGKVAQFTGMRVAVILSSFTVHHAPLDPFVLLKQDYESSTPVQFAQNLVVSSSSSPPAVSKLVAYTLGNLVFPRKSIPVPYRIMPKLNNFHVKSYKNIYHASALYGGAYFPPSTTNLRKWMTFLSSITGTQIIFGIEAGICQRINTIIGKEYFQREVQHLYFYHNFQRRITDWDYLNTVLKNPSDVQQKNSLATEVENLNFLRAITEAEGKNFLNFLAEVLVQFKSTISNMIIVQSSNAIMDFLRTAIPYGDKNNRNRMFQKLSLPISVRHLHYALSTQEQIIKYISAVHHQEQYFQKLFKEYQKTSIVHKAKVMSKIKKKIAFPTLLIFTEYGDFWSRYIVQYINAYVAKSFPASFDCISLQQSLAYFADNPEASTASFLTYLFNIVKDDQQLKKIFWDTKGIKYRLDFLLFPNVHNLLRTRFDNTALSSKDFLALSLFLEKLHQGIYSTYIFTVDRNSMMHQIDPAIRRRIDYLITIKSCSNVHQLELTDFLIHLYSFTDFSSTVDLSFEELLGWTWFRIRKNPKAIGDIKLLLIELYKLAKIHRIKFNARMLHLMAKKMHV